MQCLRKFEKGPGHVGLAELPRPTPKPGQVLVQVKRAGICGTDLHILHGQFAKVKPPVTLGHEIAGVVAEAGLDGYHWKPGDRVTLESEAASCGKCFFCHTGRTNLCPERSALGYGQDGGFADFVLVRETALHRLPEHISFAEGALCEPLAVAVHAVQELATVDPDSTVLITGPGTIGLLVLQLVRLGGARAVLAGLESDAFRFQTAEQLGVDAVLTAGREPFARQLRRTLGRADVDALFECSGSPQALDEAVPCIRSGGFIVQLGLCGRPAELDLDQLVCRELRLYGSFVHTRATWEKAVDLLDTKRVTLKELISCELPLTDWRRAFEIAEQGKKLKVLFSLENDSSSSKRSGI